MLWEQNFLVDKEAASEFAAKFVRRTADARDKAGFTQDEMADYLDISQSTYSKYEIRTPLPHRYILQFCRRTGVSVEWLLGKRKKKRRRRPFKKLQPASQRSA